MYEALTGFPPHQGETPLELMYKHLTVAASSLEMLAVEPSTRRLGALVDRLSVKRSASQASTCFEILVELKEIFSNKLDTSKFFAAESSPQKRRMPIAAGLVIVLLGVLSCLAFIMMQWKASSRLDGTVPDSKLDIMIRAYNKARQPAEKCEQATAIIRALLSQSKAQCRHDDYASAEKSLDKALNYCADAGTKYRAIVLLGIAQCKIHAGENEAAEKLLAEGLELPTDHDATPGLAFERACLRIKHHAFGSVGDDIETIEKTSYHPNLVEKQCENIATGKNAFGDAVHLIYEISKKLETEKFAGLDESMAALKLYDQMAAFLLSQDFDHTGELIRKVSELARDIPSDRPDFKTLGVSTYKLLANYEKHCGHNEAADKYRKLAQSFAD